MDGRFNHPFSNHQEDSENGSDNSGELPFGASDARSTTNSSLKRRRSVQKRVVTVPIGGGGGDADGSSRIKSDGAPPYDSWAWRKYGQKPIKGSPYPRGYYRCSSSKGCPARKQVERSRVDPTMLVITYACDHNHSGAPSRNPTSTAAAAAAITIATSTTTTSTAAAAAAADTSPVESPIYATQSEDKFTELSAEVDEFTWFSDVASTSETILVNSIENSMNTVYGESDVEAAAVIFPMGEEDESLFADLGELPECSVVFQRGFLDQEKGRRCILRAG